VTLGDRGVKWPDPYLPGRDQIYRLAAQRDAKAELKV
jgi:anthraniloyl-CoA monooxygenase